MKCSIFLLLYLYINLSISLYLCVCVVVPWRLLFFTCGKLYDQRLGAHTHTRVSGLTEVRLTLHTCPTQPLLQVAYKFNLSVFWIIICQKNKLPYSHLVCFFLLPPSQWLESIGTDLDYFYQCPAQTLMSC